MSTKGGDQKDLESNTQTTPADLFWGTWAVALLRVAKALQSIPKAVYTRSLCPVPFFSFRSELMHSCSNFNYNATTTRFYCEQCMILKRPACAEDVMSHAAHCLQRLLWMLHMSVCVCVKIIICHDCLSLCLYLILLFPAYSSTELCF